MAAVGATRAEIDHIAPPGRRGTPRLRAVRRAVLVVSGTAVALGAVELIAVLHGPLSPTWVSLMIPVTAAAYLGAGAAAWLRRPSSDLGALLTVGGVTWLVTGFGNTEVPALVALGAVIATAPLAIAVHLLVAFPSGRLTGRPAWALVLAAYGTALVLQAPLYFFSAPPAPYDVLTVADRPDLLEAGVWIQRGVGVAVMALTSVLLVARLRAATRSQRRVLVPLYAYGVGAILALPLVPTLVTPALDLGPITTYVVQLTLAALIPVGFGWSLMRGGFARTAEVEELGAWLGVEERARPTLRKALADTLGDPTLDLMFWVPDRDAYVDADGQPAEWTGDARRGVSEVELAGQRVGAITYELEAIGDRELVRTAGRIIAMALDRERLTAELLANESALRESRQRIVEAGDRERRRVERNLHDGAQQRIMSAVLSLRMVEARIDRADPTNTTLVAGAATDLEEAMRELRALTRGLHPTLLTDIGLSGALESLAEQSSIPVRLTVLLTAELPDATGVGAYFVVAEALTNAARHSRAAQVHVRAVVDGGRLRVEVSDDGVGGALATRGSGLEGLIDRVEALGGRLSVTSPAGRGTAILAELPCG